MYDLEPVEMYDANNSLAALFSLGPMMNKLRTLTLAVCAHVRRPLYRELVVSSAKTLRHLTTRFAADGWLDEVAIRELIGYVADSLGTFEYSFRGTDKDTSLSCAQLVHALNALKQVRHLYLPIKALTSVDVIASLQALNGLQEVTLTCDDEMMHSASFADSATFASTSMLVCMQEGVDELLWSGWRCMQHFCNRLRGGGLLLSQNA